MRKLFYLLILSLITIFVACGQKSTCRRSEQTLTSQKIQNTFFGMTLGKTKLHQGKDLLIKSGVEYMPMDGFGEMALVVNAPMTFGGIQWETEEFIFYRNVLSGVSFSIDSASVKLTKKEKGEIHKQLISQLKSKYPKHKITYSKVNDIETDEEFEAFDSLYIVSVNCDNNGGIWLNYSIRGDKRDKIIPSEL